MLQSSPRGDSNPLTYRIRAYIADEPSGLNPLRSEPERGLEPTDLRFTKPLLCQLSYSGIKDSLPEISKNHNAPSPQLEGAKQTLDMLSPQNQELILTLLRQLAEREKSICPMRQPQAYRLQPRALSYGRPHL